MTDAKYEVGDILSVYQDSDPHIVYYFLIEGAYEPSTGSYAYRCLNDNKTGFGNFGHPNTVKVA